MSFLSELRRRNVVKVGAAYLVVAWLLIQVAATVLPTFDAPRWAVQTLTFLLIIGFPIALVLAWVYELTSEGIKRTSEVPPAHSITPVTGQKLNVVITGALALAVVLLVLDNYVLEPEGPEIAAAPEAAAPAQPAPTPARAVLSNSVAVLPFVNLSPSADDAYFAAGIHEEILNYLAQLSELNVIGRTSVLRYANTELSIREIADELNVETVMEGSVRYAGDEVRITAQLIDPATGAHLWSEAYQRRIDDIFAIQADIAMNIANAIGAEFSVAEQNALEKPLTSSPAAYALYLQAAEVFRSGGGMEVGHALLDRAIAIDPEFALAYAQKASLYASAFVNSVQGTAVVAEDRAALERRIRENAEIAISLDPTDPRTRQGLALVNVLTWRWTAALETIDPATEERVLTPGLLTALLWMGRNEDALRIAKRVAELNPNDAQGHLNLGFAQAFSGDRAASNRSLNRALELSPTTVLARTWLGYNAVAVGDVDRAQGEFEILERVLGASPPLVFLPELAYAYSRLGRSDDVERLFAEVESRAAETDVGAGAWAMAYLARGDEDEALRWLEIGAEKARKYEPDPGIVHLMNLRLNFLDDPRLKEPRFAEVLSRIRGE